MIILALDPGTTQTGWCTVSDDMRVLSHGISSNRDMLCNVRAPRGLLTDNIDKLAIEMIASYGMPVGREVFETCVWIGRFTEAWSKPDEVMTVYRKDVKMQLCGSPRAKDANIRQAIIDLYEPSGGGTTPQIGVKSKPGPLYGVSSHVWPALGVALVAHRRCGSLKVPDSIPLYGWKENGIEEDPF